VASYNIHCNIHWVTKVNDNLVRSELLATPAGCSLGTVYDSVGLFGNNEENSRRAKDHHGLYSNSWAKPFDRNTPGVGTNAGCYEDEGLQ